MNLKKSYYKVEKGSINTKIEVPSSKSHANRALILAAICKEDILLTNIPPSTDVYTMLKCFSSLGLEIEKSNSGLTIKGSFPECEVDIDSPLILQTGDGGTTNRFLIALLALGKRQYIIEPEGHMKNRPMDTLFNSLKSLGVSVEYNDKDYALIKGPVKTSDKMIKIDAGISTQFATGLALALSSLNITVETSNLDGSALYFELTKHLIEYFSKIKSNNYRYNIPVDFSSLSYPVALSLFHDGIEITNCTNIDQFQPDSSFLNIIKKMGGDFDFNKGHLSIEAPDVFKSLSIDCKEFPDLVPTLAFCLSYADGDSHLYNLRSLRVKECDRIEETMAILKSFDVSVVLNNDDSLLIKGKVFNQSDKAAYAKVDPPFDHRMIMITYLFMRLNNGGEISNFKSVEKSFSNFFDVMES